MSGHSKWSNIKHRKEKSDAKRGKVFTKLGREISLVVKEGGADPESNSKLKDVIAKAKAENMPNENIMRSIKKAAGSADDVNYEEITYEGYGPGGVAVVVEAMTENKNRTAADIRHIFDKYGGNMGTTGCVSFLFNRKGLILIPKEGFADEDSVMMDALDAGAEDVVAQDDMYEVTTAPDNFSRVREEFEKRGYEFEVAEIQMIPVTTVSLTDEKYIQNLEKLVDIMEDLDDVQNVFNNFRDDYDD
jgi:YebC/PmpR family DNA-binding regulatory protein